MTDYTPTTDEVLEGYAANESGNDALEAWGLGSISAPHPPTESQARESAERWLAEQDREVAEKAWDACADLMRRATDQAEDIFEAVAELESIGNPYRVKEGE